MIWSVAIAIASLILSTKSCMNRVELDLRERQTSSMFQISSKLIAEAEQIQANCRVVRAYTSSN